VAKPRVRGTDGSGEIGLETWAALADRDLLAEHTLVAMLAGVSTRNYASVLEPAGPDGADASSSTSRSAVSRRFVKATANRLVEFRSRPLDDRAWSVVFIDGFGFGDETMVGAIGVDEAGNKLPLTVMHGTTENKTVVTRLLNNLTDRGLTADDGLLFVIDGGKALFHAVTDKFDGQALIQRCRFHKTKNGRFRDLRGLCRSGWCGVEVESAEVEVDGGLEVVAVAVAAGGDADGLDARVETFGGGASEAVGEEGHDAVVVTFDHLGDVDDGLEP
jgi:hypothetical protein